MKIGIDVREAADPKSGKSQYLFHVMRELLRIDARNEYVLYARDLTPALTQTLSNTRACVHLTILPCSAARFHLAAARDFVRQGGDVFFAGTSFIIPAFLPKKIRSVMTVHDLAAFLPGARHQLKATLIERIFLPRALKKAHRILTPSINTKRDLMRLFKVPEEKISVTPLGVSEEFARAQSPEVLEKTRTRYDLPQEFILSVSGLEPRKNLGLVLEALALKPDGEKLPPLVIVGGRGWKSAALERRIRGMKGRVWRIDGVASEELSTFYKLAKVFVYPSLYEGFGLPPLEAMASGCPVICSNAASLPEVVGDAALLFDPQDSHALYNGLRRVLADEYVRVDLSRRGRTRAAKFTWKETAELTLEALQKA